MIEAIGLLMMVGAVALLIAAPRVAAWAVVKLGNTSRGRRFLRWLREVAG
jgi:membrane-anchored protein YejM (alkaline phosphatase superfamily)